MSETYGHQEGTAYNGHFGCTCYHPLLLFNPFGDLERALLLAVVASHLGVAAEAPGSLHLGKTGWNSSRECVNKR